MHQVPVTLRKGHRLARKTFVSVTVFNFNMTTMKHMVKIEPYRTNIKKENVQKNLINKISSRQTSKELGNSLDLEHNNDPTPILKSHDIYFRSRKASVTSF